MEPATVLSVSLAGVVMAITGYAVYISFGPPSTQLDDPFDDHDD